MQGAMASFTKAQRMSLAKRGHALPDGSFPITDAEDLRNAIRDVGRASDPARAKQHIIRQARRLQMKSALPLSWM